MLIFTLFLHVKSICRPHVHSAYVKLFDSKLIIILLVYSCHEVQYFSLKRKPETGTIFKHEQYSALIPDVCLNLHANSVLSDINLIDHNFDHEKVTNLFYLPMPFQPCNDLLP